MSYRYPTNLDTPGLSVTLIPPACQPTCAQPSVLSPRTTLYSSAHASELPHCILPDSTKSHPSVSEVLDLEKPSQGSTASKLDPLAYSVYVQNLWPHATLGAFPIAETYMKIYSAVRKTGLPNYLEAKIPIPSDLKCDTWDTLLADYDDGEIAHYLRYGWPSSYTAFTPPTPASRNHPSAVAHSANIDRFLEKELSKDALLGPFSVPPFSPWCQICPLMTVPKKESNKRRVIIDLSYPKGASVNDGVAKNFFQGRELSYTLPSAADLSALLLAMGPGSFIWKADLERAYRQLRSDPLDYPLMGISHKGRTFIDVCPSFGCRGSAAAQQRVARAVCFLMRNMGHQCFAYVDDFCGTASTFTEALKSFTDFESLCDSLGLQLAPDKTTFPTTSLEWLGFNFDSIDMSVTIPEQKLQEVRDLARVWTYKKVATKRELQVLAGKLMHISHCILPARKFMSRILALLRAAPPEGTVKVDCELRRDVKWFIDYAAECNGRLLLNPTLPELVIECDACLEGAGGFSPTHYYSLRFPPNETKNRHISQLEAINVVMALKSLVPPTITHHHVKVVTDNLASVYALNTGRTRDYVLAACSRELWLIAATQELTITLDHAPGESLVLADALSRRHKASHYENTVSRFVQHKSLTWVNPCPLRYVLTNYL